MKDRHTNLSEGVKLGLLLYNTKVVHIKYWRIPRVTITIRNKLVTPLFSSRHLWANRSASLILSESQKVLKWTNYNKKGRKTAEKNVSTSFRVLQAPESWSKYTTVDPDSPILGTHRLTIVNLALEKYFSRQMVVFTQDKILDMH